MVRAGIHPLKLGVPKQAGEYLSGLQDVMAGSPPPWLDNLMRGSGSAAEPLRNVLKENAL